MTKETLEAMEACEPQANLYMAAEEYAEEQAYDFKGVCDVEDYKELAELLKQAVVYGAHWKEQQLMKKAREGIVTTNIDGWINVMTGFIRPEEAGANFGDKADFIKNSGYC